MKRVLLPVLLAAGLCAGRVCADEPFVPTYDAGKAWYLGELGVTNLLNEGITGRGVRVGVIDFGFLQAARVPPDYRRQAAFDAERAAFVRTESAVLLNERFARNEEQGRWEVEMRPGESLTIEYRLEPANATDRNLYWYCGNMPTFSPIGLDQVLTVPAKTKPGEFLVYFARNSAREVVAKLKVTVVAGE